MTQTCAYIAPALITDIDASRIGKDIKLAPVVKSLKEFFASEETKPAIKKGKDQDGQTITICFAKPVEAKAATLAVEFALARAIDKDRIGDKSVLQEKGIVLSAAPSNTFKL